MYQSALKLPTIRTRDESVMYPMIPPKPLHYVQALCANIECKKAKFGLLRASRHADGHRNTARRTGTHVKR